MSNTRVTVTPAARTAYATYSTRTLRFLLDDLNDDHRGGRSWSQDDIDTADVLCDLIAERNAGRGYPGQPV